MLLFWDIRVPDLDKAAVFYSKVWGWTIEPDDSYLLVTIDGEVSGMISQGNGLIVRTGFIPYFKSENLPALRERALMHGGTIVQDITDDGSGSEYIEIADDQGVVIGALNG